MDQLSDHAADNRELIAVQARKEAAALREHLDAERRQNRELAQALAAANAELEAVRNELDDAKEHLSRREVRAADAAAKLLRRNG